MLLRDRLALLAWLTLTRSRYQQTDTGINYGASPSPPAVITTTGHETNATQKTYDLEKDADPTESYNMQEGKTLDMPAFMNEVGLLSAPFDGSFRKSLTYSLMSLCQGFISQRWYTDGEREHRPNS